GWRMVICTMKRKPAQALSRIPLTVNAYTEPEISGDSCPMATSSFSAEKIFKSRYKDIGSNLERLNRGCRSIRGSICVSYPFVKILREKSDWRDMWLASRKYRSI